MSKLNVYKYLHMNHVSSRKTFKFRFVLSFESYKNSKKQHYRRMKVVCPNRLMLRTRKMSHSKSSTFKLLIKTCPVLIFLLFHHSLIIILRFSCTRNFVPFYDISKLRIWCPIQFFIHDLSSSRSP